MKLIECLMMLVALSFCVPSHVSGAVDVPEQVVEVATSAQTPLGEAWTVFARSKKARKLFEDALKRRKVTTINLCPLKPTAAIPYGCFDARTNTIYVNPNLSLSGRVAVLLGEVFRAWDTEENFEKKAGEGKLSRVDYVKEAEKRGFKLVKKHHDISSDAVKKGLWPAATDWYRRPLKSWRSFKDYLAAMNIAMQGDGPSHADHFRRRWDRFYKNKFKARRVRS